MLHKRGNTTAPFAEHLKFQEQMTFTDTFGWIVVNKNRKLESRGYTVWNFYIQGAPQKNRYHCFFREATKISRINAFNTYILGK